MFPNLKRNMEVSQRGQKRSRIEPDSGSSRSSNPSQPTDFDTANPKSSTSMPEMPEGGEWQVATSKRQKKRKLKHEEPIPDYPSLRLSNQMPATLRVKDLQDLVLYVLADGVAPTWIAVNKAKDVHKVVVLMVQGIDRPALQKLRRNHTEAPSSLSETSNGQGGDAAPSTELQASNSTHVHVTDDARVADLEYIVSVKAPGDSRNGKVYSPLQAMLLSPHPASHVQRSRNNEAFAAVRTPISAYVHSADELLEAEYPVHPAAFTSTADARLEGERREKVKQSAEGGWVDTRVTSSSPIKPEGADAKSLEEGFQVYAIDCEMVQTEDDVFSLARISIVDWAGKVIMDKYVKPGPAVKNYFTEFSGITPEILQNVTTKLEDIQAELLELLTASTILLGHSLESDLNAMRLTHPFIVDTSIIYPHPRGLPLRSSLKFLANKHLKREIQTAGAKGHNSVEDARAVLDLVKLKCEKGPRFGTMEQSGESIFTRLQRSSKTSAMVEYGTPERGLGKEATYAIGSQNDVEIVQGIRRAVSGDDGKGLVPHGGVDFVFSRLRAIEFARGWSSRPHSGDAVQGQPSSEETTTHKDSADGKADKAVAETIKHLQQIYDSLPADTVLIVYHGNGDMQPVLRLQAIQKQFKKEFKVKKWDELSVKWTDTEEQALRRAVDDARDGAGLVCVK